MPYSFENGGSSPKIPNQPKFSRKVIALALGAGCVISYIKIEEVRLLVDQALSEIQKNLPGIIEAERNSHNIMK